MKIDILKIGERSLDAPEKKQIPFESLDEYLLAAKKMISTHAPHIRSGLAEEMLSNDDAISNIAHALMMADWRFDGRGNRHGYKKKMGVYAIKNYATRSGRNMKRRQLSLDTSLNPVIKSETFAANLKDEGPGPVEIIGQEEEAALLNKKMEEILSSDLISDQQADYLRQYYFEGKTLEEIATPRGVSKQSVSDMMKKARNILKNYISDDNFFRGIIYED